MFVGIFAALVIIVLLVVWLGGHSDRMKKRADGGDPAAQYSIGTGHLTGNGLPKDHGLAYRYLKMAADQNHPAAAIFCGALLWLGLADDGSSYKTGPSDREYHRIKRSREYYQLAFINGIAEIDRFVMNFSGLDAPLGLREFRHRLANRAESGQAWAMELILEEIPDNMRKDQIVRNSIDVSALDQSARKRLGL